MLFKISNVLFFKKKKKKKDRSHFIDGTQLQKRVGKPKIESKPRRLQIIVLVGIKIHKL